jgi:hypothetical protein
MKAGKKNWSGRPDLNWGPLGPEPSALPGYATPRINHEPRRVTSEKPMADALFGLITGHSSRFKRLLVGTAGFEPTTTCTPSKCATRLRYVPAIRAFTLKNGLNSTGIKASIIWKRLSRFPQARA